MKKSIEGRLVVVSGPSGVGKGTICRELISRHPEVGLSISATTREPRKGEVEGVNYYFKTKKEFLDLVYSGGMLEYAETYGNYYGTPLSPVMQSLEQGKSVILEIEMQGAMQVKEKYPRAVLVFVLPPSMKELFRRIENRGTESPEALAKREQAAHAEIERVKEYDYFIINDTVDRSAEDLYHIIDSAVHNRDDVIKKHVVGKSIDTIIAKMKEEEYVTTIN